MPEGGRITIETRRERVDETEAEKFPGLAPGDHTAIIVSDTGSGMDVETRAHLFEPFFSTKGNQGTGLGLAIVYSNVKQNGGAIECESSLGQGTRFTVLFPVCADPPATGGEPAGVEAGGASLKGSETVLVVEDEKSILAVAVELLGRYGYKVLSAASGEEALKVYRDHGGTSIDLLLTDVILPNMTGRELADRLLALRPDLPVVYTSGYTGPVIAQHGVLEPGINFIQKPYSTQTLLSMIRRTLDTRNDRGFGVSDSGKRRGESTAWEMWIPDE